MKVKWLLTFSLVAVLLLGACGGSDDNTENQDQAIATPVPTLAPADTGTTDTGTTDTGTTDTGTTDTGTTDTGATDTTTNTSSATGTDATVVNAADVTDTVNVTDVTGANAGEAGADTGVVADVQVVTDTVVVTDTALVTSLVLVTQTALVTDTAVVTNTVLVTDSAPLTESAEVVDVGIVTGTEEAASPMTHTVLMSDTEVVTETVVVTDTKVVTDAAGMRGTLELTGTDAMTGTGTTTDTGSAVGAAAGAAGAAAATAVTDTTDTGAATQLQTPQQVETYGVVRASELMDFNVENTAGDDLGDVDDAIVTLPNGCIQYVLLSSGGFLGLGEDKFLVPWRAVALNLQNGSLVLNVDQSAFDNAPIFDSNNMPDMNLPNWDADIRGFWDSMDITPPAAAAPAGEVPAAAVETDTAAAGATGTVTDVNAAVPGAMTTTVQGQPAQDIIVEPNPCDMSMGGAGAAVGANGTMTDTGTTNAAGGAQQGANVQAPGAVQLSQLMDFDVSNSQGDDLGSLEDIVIDWQHSRIAYAILSFGGFLGLGDKWFVIPFNAVTLDPLNNKFVFDVDKQTLENAPGFDSNQLPNTTDPNWDQEIQNFWNNVQSGLNTDNSGG